jgi:catechol 2,3-dioxygenase-like lactoylglutathione lyase family enzyme
MQRYNHSTLFYSDNRKFASSKYAVVKQRDSASSASFACPRNELGITRCDERCPAEQGDADLPILIVLDEHRRKASLNISMLKHSHVATRLPAHDLERARLFYAEKLSLEPVEERPGGLLYRCGSGSFALFISSGVSSGQFTQMAFEVTDLEATVQALRARGVMFEEYDLPGLKTVDGIAKVEGNYPSKSGVGELAAWFKDSEGNLLAIGQPLGAGNE